MKWLCLFVAIISEVIGTSALKASQGFTRLIPSLLVIGGYSTAFYFLSLTLKAIPVGIAYAIWSGVGILLVSIAGFVLYRLARFSSNHRHQSYRDRRNRPLHVLQIGGALKCRFSFFSIRKNP